MMPNRSGHGFVWPAGMPPCALCGSPAMDTIHVTPSPTAGMRMMAKVEHRGGLPRQSHAYVTPLGTPKVLCLSCGGPLIDSRHPAGRPSGRLLAAAAQTNVREAAFVAEVDGRLIFAGRGGLGADFLPTEMLDALRSKAATASANMWITGRYVEADAPNRNAAYWSTADLEVGQPTVAHGPINWLHEERHIIGAIADSKLVLSRESAAEGEVGNHIVALGAIWPFIYPEEARMIRDASESNQLWFSMECVSRAIACLADDCEVELPYGDYMRQKASRCEHMNDGAPRRFIDPVFEGAGIIVPPVRPGWARADARVLMPQAAALAERQAAAFDGMETSSAEMLVAQLIASVEPAEPVS